MEPTSGLQAASASLFLLTSPFIWVYFFFSFFFFFFFFSSFLFLFILLCKKFPRILAEDSRPFFQILCELTHPIDATIEIPYVAFLYV